MPIFYSWVLSMQKMHNKNNTYSAILYIQVSNYSKIITSWWSKSSINRCATKWMMTFFWQAVHGQVCLQPWWYYKNTKARARVCDKVRTLNIGKPLLQSNDEGPAPESTRVTIRLLERTRRYVFSVISVILSYRSCIAYLAEKQAENTEVNFNVIFINLWTRTRIYWMA